MGKKTIEPNINHQEFHEDFLKLMEKHASKTSSLELLAVASQVVGKIIAYQDPNECTPERAFAIINFNIEAGNKQVVKLKKEGN